MVPVYNAGMIPLRIHRALIVLCAISAIIGMFEESAPLFGTGRELAKMLAGALTGCMVFFLAYEGGRVLTFCGKGFVQDVERRGKVRAALMDIGILEERRSGNRGTRARSEPKAMIERRQNRGQDKLLMYVSIVDSDRFIAITVNQGKSYRAFISTHLVDSMSSSALRGVLAHEYGHVSSQHPFKQAVLLGLVAGVKLSIGVPVGAVVAILLAYLFMLREWEFVADASAVVRTGREDVLAAFDEYLAISGEKDMSVWSEFVSGHPSMHRRVAAVSAGHHRIY